MTDTFDDTSLNIQETTESKPLEILEMEPLNEPLINKEETEASAVDATTAPTQIEESEESEDEPTGKQNEEPTSASILEIVTDTASTIVDTVTTVDEIFTDASNVIAANPDKVEEIVMDASDVLATTAAIATGAPPAPHISRLIGIFTRLFSNIFHLFKKVKEE